MADAISLLTSGQLIVTGVSSTSHLTIAAWAPMQSRLVDQAVLSKMWVLRRILMQMGTIDAMQFLLDKMKDAKSNEDFFASMNQ